MTEHNDRHGEDHGDDTGDQGADTGDQGHGAGIGDQHRAGGYRRGHLPRHGLGIDIGGTGIKGALVDLRDGSLVSERFRLDTPQPSTPKAVADTVAAVASQIDYAGPVGVTFPGVVQRGTVLTAANVDASWVHTSLIDTLSPVLPGPVTGLNDADAAGLAEVRYGAGEDRSGLVIMVTLGTGIGTALIHDGLLVPNSELGHIEVDGHDAESRASVSARERRGMTWEQWAHKVQKYLRRLEQVLWPELFIIGGGVSRKPDKWFDLIHTRTPKVIARLANNAGIVGAALAAAEAAARAPGPAHDPQPGERIPRKLG